MPFGHDITNCLKELKYPGIGYDSKEYRNHQVPVKPYITQQKRNFLYRQPLRTSTTYYIMRFPDRFIIIPHQMPKRIGAGADEVFKINGILKIRKAIAKPIIVI